MTSRPRAAIHDPAPLSVAEHDRILRVLTDCAAARTVDAFRETAMASLSHHLGFRTATVFSGATFSTVFTDPDPLHTGRAVPMFAEYHDHWSRDDFFATPQSRRCLQATRVGALSELAPIVPDRAHRFITEFFLRGGLTSAVGLYLQVSPDQKSLVGLFGNDDPVREQRHAYLLRRLAEPLNAISRRLEAGTTQPKFDAMARLTARQREVALLVAEGLSNAAIAQLLVLREDTVKKYVSSILAALRCDSRTQVAVLVAQSQPVTVT